MVTIKQKKAAQKILGNQGISVAKAMKEAGYSEATINTPSNLTDSKGWKELMEAYLSDEKLSKAHDALLSSTRLDHMVFPLGPADSKELASAIAMDIAKAAEKNVPYVPKDYLTDADIEILLKSVNCTVRRFVHGETARHVYFWANDNKSRKEGLDMAYKLKGKYAPEKTVSVNVDVEMTLTAEDKKLIDIIREHDRNGGDTRTETVATEGNLSDGVGQEPQNKDV